MRSAWCGIVLLLSLTLLAQGQKKIAARARYLQPTIDPAHYADPLTVWVILPKAPPRKTVDPTRLIRESTVGDFSGTSAAPALEVVAAESRDRVWGGFTEEARQVFPNIHIHWAFADQYQAELAEQQERQRPGVFVGEAVPPELAFPVFNPTPRIEQGVPTAPPKHDLVPVRLARFEYPGTPGVRELFMEWISEYRTIYKPLADTSWLTEAPTAIAKDSYAALLANALPGALDDDAAGLERWQAPDQHGSYDPADRGTRAWVDPLLVSANLRLAVVALRAGLWDQGHFTITHGLVVLRKDGQGRWRVLQSTPYLDSAQMKTAFDTLAPFCRMPPREGPFLKIGISQASPIDGDLRAPQPEFWWDNLGGASLQVVEWQTDRQEGWLRSNLFFIHDTNPRLQVRVEAQFAKLPGSYRWRVWSLAPGGVTAISPWRSLQIAER